MKLLLASQSPRRSAILHELGILHEICPADIAEVRRPEESPEAYVERLAREKAMAVYAAVARTSARTAPPTEPPLTAPPSAPHFILAGDTTVALGPDVLEKPVDAEDAVRMLMALSGVTHRVASGLALLQLNDAAPLQPQIWSGVSVTEVRFRPFERDEAERYVATGEPMDKAGAYGIQGLGGVLVDEIRGDFTTVVGLPVPLLVRLLAEAGTPYRFPERA
jgi:septum formation protein